MRRPALTTLLIGAATAGGVVAAVLVIGSPSTSSAQERTVTVARGVIQSTASGSGNLEPANQAELSFGAGGEVTHVYVKEGDHVSEGDLLAEIDPGNAEVDLAQAQADLQSAQDTLDAVQSGASSSGSSSSSSASTASAAASGAGGSGSSISQPAAEANVQSAELSVENAEKEVDATKLRAPMAGTIAAVNGAVGQTVSASSASSSSSSASSSSGSGGAGAGGSGGGGSSSSSSSSSSEFITLAQLSRYKMEVSLSESDIASVKVGQPATVTVNAASGEQFAAHVTDIGVLASSSSSSAAGSSTSAVSYPVTLTLDQTAKKLKAGMSATADIVTAQVSGISIPTQALNGSTVTVVRNGKQVTQRVQTGVTGDSTTQITSGLNVGDTIVVRSVSAAAGAGQSTTNLSNRLGRALAGGGLGGGLQGGGGGGGFGGAARRGGP